MAIKMKNVLDFLSLFIYVGMFVHFMLAGAGGIGCGDITWDNDKEFVMCNYIKGVCKNES
jgi:hypothetical protein